MAPFARPVARSATILAARLPNQTARPCTTSNTVNARLTRHYAGPRALGRLQTVSKARKPSLSSITRLRLADSSVEESWLRSWKPLFSLTNRLSPRCIAPQIRRNFHTYFVTHLPSSSVHPDSRLSHGPGHKLPRDASTPHTPSPGSAPAVAPPYIPSTRDLTVVRIPMRRAKHHLGVSTDRGSRPYNEDRDQAGTISLPAFAKRAPRSVQQKPGEATPADSALGDPQVFYFGVFDGHGGTQCADFIRDELPGYIENASKEFGLQSSLRKTKPGREHHQYRSPPKAPSKEEAPKPVKAGDPEEVKKDMNLSSTSGGIVEKPVHGEPIHSAASPPAEVRDHAKAIQLEKDLVKEYKDTVGGYFRRFYPEHFVLSKDGSNEDGDITIESVLTYAFLRADLDFVSAQAQKVDPDDSRVSDIPLNNDEILGVPHAAPSGHGIGGVTRFKGGSTASIALISTPTAAPFWHPAAHSTLLCAHVGDSRILLCDTATGLAQPLTSDHHPSNPTETRRLRRYAPAGSMVSGDSFGEERIAGLANSRAFGDMKSKRIGVSAEPEITRVEMGPAEYSFIVLMSDGISGTLSDQEIVDVVKEARTPEEGARSVVSYATEVSSDGDNATCQVVRLGGWERRSEGGLGSLGTKELRDMRISESLDPRRGKR
ncbi:phosphatase 2C-like domain-containing protein [Dactylonectria estremocensis]|uniref:Phosphatase 2C-like domain-containing protein n=1 Tax=Dactylonectria estremocensis TaxID=1079267 RepID=A0A9P9J7A7_9HYPO|nr:phosphatase 2C-like domain-containing protein [Dactylonectria estremocensis]